MEHNELTFALILLPEHLFSHEVGVTLKTNSPIHASETYGYNNLKQFTQNN